MFKKPVKKFLWGLIARFTHYFKQKRQKALASNFMHRVQSLDGDLYTSAFPALSSPAPASEGHWRL